MKFYSKNSDKTKDNQMAFDYSTYMIASSYFDSVKCITPFYESKLYIRYNELSKEKQYTFEKQCIDYMEKTLLAKLPPCFFKEETTIRLIGAASISQSYILFENSFGKLLITANFRGSKTRFICKYQGNLLQNKL